MGNPSAQVLTKFNADARKKYIEGLKKTYLGVLLSTELDSKTSKIKGVKAHIESLITNNKTEGEITVDGIKVNVTLTKKDNIYNVKFNEDSSKIDIKNTSDYTAKDLLTLCAQHELTISKDKKGNNVFSVTIKGADKGKNTTVGGPDKISIFTGHLSYIKETIEHLEKDGNPTKEFALATGTGKTFIELILEYIPARLMGTRYVSIAPDESLINQKRDDWKKYLSDGDIADIELDKISDEKGCSILTTQGLINNWNQFLKAIGLEQLPGIIEALKIGDKKFEIKNGKINVDGKDFVILANGIQHGDKTYEIDENGKVEINNQEFKLDVTKSVFATFDEEHRIVFEELYKGCMGFVSILCKTLFLSATPSQNTYDSVKECGGFLKTLSLMEKMKSDAFGNLALNVYDTQEEKQVDSHIKKLGESVTFKTKKLKNGKDDPFYHIPKTDLTGDVLKQEIETYIFHNAESAIGKSALISVETRDLKDELKKKVTHDIFRNESTGGNHSNAVAQKRTKIIEHLSAIYGSDKSSIIGKIVDDNLDYKSKIHDYSAFCVMHRIIDNTLSCLTGLSGIELNKERFSDPAELVKKVREALESGNYNLGQYVTKQSIESEELKNEIVKQMQSVIDVLTTNKGNGLFRRLVRNWNQDKKLHALMPLNNVPNDEGYILELFGIKGCTDLTFSERKDNSIFQPLKDTYEIERNISNIEEECNDSYHKLKEAEKKRKDHYDEYIKPLEDTLARTTPTQYHWHSGSKKLTEYSPYYFNEKNRLIESAKEELERDLRHLQSQITHQLGLFKYSTLKSNVETEKGKLVRDFRKIKTEFSSTEKYQLAPLRPFSDKNRYRKGNSKDDNALVCMGLVGNAVDEDYHPGQVTDRQTRIQGFNALGLDHVVVFVDKNSNFINDPRQLVQSIRNRCFDRTSTSHYSCYSSVPLTFNPKLMLEGEYIPAFNKAMEEFNKKSPEELGNEILETIDKLIKDGVSGKIESNQKFEEIDDLAAKVIEQVISSFETVYNNKGHNAKEAQDYFAKVLGYVTSRVEKQLKKEGVAVGNLSIEHNIRGIQSKIDKIERQIRGEDNITSENQTCSENPVKNDIQSKIDDIISKINQNTKDKEETDKKLEVKGNIIKRFFVKLWRFIRRLIGLKIVLEREKIKLVEKEKVLNQEKAEVEQEKSEFEIGVQKNIDPNVLKEQKTELEKEKLALETKKESKEKQEFIGVVKKKENIQEKKIDPKEMEDIIKKQKAHNEKLLEEKKQELVKIEEEDGASLTKLEELKDKIKSFESIKEDIKKLITNSSSSHHSHKSHTTPSNLEALKTKIGELNQPKDEKTEIEKIVEKLNKNIKKLEEGLKEKNDDIKEENQTLLKETKDEFAKLQTEKIRLEEIIKKKTDLETEKAELKTILSCEENGVDYDKYYNNVVNQVLAKRSIEKSYESVQIHWITKIFTEFKQVFKKPYYKNKPEGAQKHISDCIESQVFVELFSNTFVPLINDGTLLIALNACYPGINNEGKVEKINEYYNILIENQADKEVNPNDIECIIEYIEKVQNYIKGIKQGSGSYYDLAISKANSEIERLEKKEKRKVRLDILECILTPIGHSPSPVRYWVGSNPSKQEKVAFAAGQVGTELRDVKSSTIRDVVSPDDKSLNPIQACFPKGKISDKLDDTVAEKWTGEKLCAIGA